MTRWLVFRVPGVHTRTTTPTDDARRRRIVASRHRAIAPSRDDRRDRRATERAIFHFTPHAMDLLDDDVDENASTLTINARFAARFEHNERRKEMDRLQEKLGKEYARSALDARSASDTESGDTEESTSESSEDDDAIANALDENFVDVLRKIRRKDPSIYDETTTLFADASEDEDGGGKGGKDLGEVKARGKKEKKVKATLREVTAKQLLEGGARALEDAEDEAGRRGVDAGPTYVEEQAALKRAFKDAVESSEDDGDDDGGLVVKTRAEKMEADAVTTEKLSEYFNSRAKATGVGELSAEDKFLREYLMDKKWLKGDEKSATTLKFKNSGEDDDDDDASGEDDDDAESDSELLRRAEEFEHKYNFRFEEPGADQIVSHSRHIEGLVRQKDTRRSDKRREIKERKESEREKLLAEVRRLKNLKRQEIDNKMKQISSIGGVKNTVALSAADLTTEFDPEAHDKAMRQMYGDEYYDEDEEDPSALEKPEFGDLEDELAVVLKNKGDEPLKGESSDKGFEALRKNVAVKTKEFMESLAGNAIDSDEDDDGSDEDEKDEKNKFSKRASKRWRKELLVKMDEYYNLDAEDFIGDLPVRFPYKEVAPKMFGLSTKDVLTMDDKSLNQIVGLKKLAPYRDDANDATVDANQKSRAKRMAREFLLLAEASRGTSSTKKKNKKKKSSEDDADEEDELKSREKSYADAAFGKKASKSKKRDDKKSVDDDDEPLPKKGKNATKNAKKRAKKKLALTSSK